LDNPSEPLAEIYRTADYVATRHNPKVEQVAWGLTFSSSYNLGNEINSKNCDLSVLKAGKGQINRCIPERQGPQDLNNACYKEVLTKEALQAKIQQLAAKGTITSNHLAVKKFYKFYLSKEHGGKREQYEEMMARPDGSKAGPYPIAHKSPDQARKSAHTTEDKLRGRVNTLGTPKDEIAQAEGYVRWLQNGLIGYHIMSHLTSGARNGGLRHLGSRGGRRGCRSAFVPACGMDDAAELDRAGSRADTWLAPRDRPMRLSSRAKDRGILRRGDDRWAVAVRRLQVHREQVSHVQRRAAANVLRTDDESHQRGRSEKTH
jgi:hypothetical protein